jgi:ribosomal protein S18 acetylase RimI-like enzyme
VPTRRSIPVPELFAHQPPPRNDGRLAITITYLEIAPDDWTRRGIAPAIDIAVERIAAPTVEFYRELYDRVGRPWLWYERRALPDAALGVLLSMPDHELHVAHHGGGLVGYFEFLAGEIVFFGLTLSFIGRRIGPWLLDRCIARGFARGYDRLVLNTNTVDHARALETYRKAGFRIVRQEAKDVSDPRALWPDVYRWPPA